MPPVGAFAVSMASAAAAAAPAISAGVGVYSLVEQSKARKAAEAQAVQETEIRKQQFIKEAEFKEQQAGEYYELTEKQMELQAQAGQITTLANLLARPGQPAQPLVFTLPAAKTYSLAEQINRAIGRLFGS